MQCQRRCGFWNAIADGVWSEAFREGECRPQTERNAEEDEVAFAAGRFVQPMECFGNPLGRPDEDGRCDTNEYPDYYGDAQKGGGVPGCAEGGVDAVLLGSVEKASQH